MCDLFLLTIPFYSLQSANQVQRTMNLPEPISINNVDSTQDQLNDAYDVISDDSIQNDSRDGIDNCKDRIIYSRVS